nr:unnamed protein product [Callosobruchus chinensis]
MKHLSIAFLNVRSLVPHFANFKTFLENQDFDIVGVSETWLSANVPSDLISIDNYTFIRRDRNGRGGGVGMYVRNTLNFSLILSESNFLLEELWVEVKFNNLTYIIGSLYRPPRGDINDFVDYFEERLSQFIDVEIIFGGDLNVNLLDEFKGEVTLFNNCVDAFELKQIIQEPTRIGNCTMTLLDIIVVPDVDIILSCGTKDTSFISDHSLVYCVLQTPIVSRSRKIHVRNLKNIDRDLLSDFLTLSPLDNLVFLPSVEAKVAYLNQIIIDNFDILAPVKCIDTKRKKPPWLTCTIKCMIHLKKKAFNKLKRNKSAANWEYYKLVRNEVDTAITVEKKKYLESCVNECRGKSQTLWKKLRRLNISKSRVSSIPGELDNPNELNKHFLQFSAINSSTSDDLRRYYRLNKNPKVTSSLEFHTVSEEFVKEKILNIKSSAMGADHINLDMVLLCLHKILPYITNIINSCILENDFPDTWKVAKIIPLPKKSVVSS